jgi:hypothetical protein
MKLEFQFKNGISRIYATINLGAESFESFTSRIWGSETVTLVAEYDGEKDISFQVADLLWIGESA